MMNESDPARSIDEVTRGMPTLSGSIPARYETMAP